MGVEFGYCRSETSENRFAKDLVRALCNRDSLRTCLSLLAYIGDFLAVMSLLLVLRTCS